MSTDRATLAAEHRELTGKKVARLRHEGRLPAVVYGRGEASTNISLDTHDFEQLRRHTGPNALVDLSVDGKKANPVLIQSVQGMHSGVNAISGDFSTGASGLLISHGQLGGPVREFTIASTLQRMLQDIVEIGGDVDWLPMRAAGVSLVIGDVTMSGA